MVRSLVSENFTIFFTNLRKLLKNKEEKHDERIPDVLKLVCLILKGNDRSEKNFIL